MSDTKHLPGYEDRMRFYERVYRHKINLFRTDARMARPCEPVEIRDGGSPTGGRK